MKIKDKKELVYLICAVVILVLTVVTLIVWSVASRKDKPNDQPIQTKEPDLIVTEDETGVIGSKKTISATIIEEQLKDISQLVTAEYCYTGVMDYEDAKTILGLKVGLTETKLIASYDGVIKAGIDFSKARVEVDDDNKTITVKLPAAVITDVTIDNNSYKKFEEKSGLFNPLTGDEFNDSQEKLKEEAEEKAKTQGILTMAHENAKTIIRSFIMMLPEASEYTLVIQ